MNYHTFLPQFHPLIIVDRTKQTTIRSSTRVRVGETFALRFWTAKPYRSPMGILGTAECQVIHKITFTWSNAVPRIRLDGVLIEPCAAKIIAERDGFTVATEMMRHFERARRFFQDMVLIDWGNTFKKAQL